MRILMLAFCLLMSGCAGALPLLKEAEQIAEAKDVHVEIDRKDKGTDHQFAISVTTEDPEPDQDTPRQTGATAEPELKIVKPEEVKDATE